MKRRHHLVASGLLPAVLALGVAVGSWFPVQPASGEEPERDPARTAHTGRTDGTLDLTLRRRIEIEGGRYRPITKKAEWKAAQTAIIVCDMWDLHHCLNATRRGAEMAPRMNRLIEATRGRGVTIIHAPSSCMETYKTHPARLLAVETPRAKSLPRDIGKWCHSIPAEERVEYPIDQSDGGEDDDPEEHRRWAEKLKAMGRNPRAPWKSQIDALTIAEGDYISDSGEEIWSILEHRGIENVLLVGVHANMCVLGRPFGLRQMAKNGRNVALVRDMTDTMYNPARKPYVSHFTGTDLIVEYIETCVCPTVTSDQVLGGKPFRFNTDTRKRLVALVAEKEYKTDETLPAFAKAHLGNDFEVTFVFADPGDANSLPGIEAVAEADVLLVSVRRRVLPKEQLDIVRKFVASGKPVVGIRTASHAFSPAKRQRPPAGHDAWTDFDPEILGGNYTGHHGRGPKVKVEPARGAEGHPILSGVDVDKLVSSGSLYKVSPLEKTTTALLVGSIPEKAAEPVAWTNRPRSGSRVFYTSLGHADDFEQPAFNRLLRNAVYWAAELPITAK